MKNRNADTGTLLRALRKQRKLKLADIAKQCACTVSFLSKLENGHTKTSLNMLHRIANVLAVNINALIPNIEPGNSRIVRRKDRRIISGKYIRAGDGVLLEAISQSRGDHSFQINLHRIQPGGSSDGQIVHVGEEFIYVLEGSIVLCLDKKRYRLHSGDAAFFSSSEPHGYSNPGSLEALVLWVNTPPTY